MPTKSYTRASKQELSKRIGKIKSKDHYRQLFKLIHDHDASYVSTSGKGVYITLDKYDNELLTCIEEFLDEHYPTAIYRPLSEGLSEYYSEEGDDMKMTNTEKKIVRQMARNEQATSASENKTKTKTKKKSLIKNLG